MCNSSSVISGGVLLPFSPMHRQSKQWPGVVEDDKLSVAFLLTLPGKRSWLLTAIEEGNGLVGQLLVGRMGSPASRHAVAILSDVPQQQ